MRDSTGVVRVQASSASPLNQWIRVEGWITNSATAGQAQLFLYNSADSTTYDEAPISAATMNTLGTAPDETRLGAVSTIASMPATWFANYSVSNVGAIGPVGGSTPVAAQLVGFDVPWGQWSSANATIGPGDTHRLFYSGNLPTTFNADGTPSNVVIVASYKTMNTNVAAYVNSIPSNRNVILIYYHEPEDNFSLGSTYVANFKTQSDLIKAQGRSNVRVAFAANFYRYITSVGDTEATNGNFMRGLGNISPNSGQAYADIVGIDVYMGAYSFELPTTGLTDYQPWLTWLSLANDPTVIGSTTPLHGIFEYGLSDYLGNTERYNRMVADRNYLQSTFGGNLQTWMYWWQDTPGDVHYSYQFTDSATVALWQSIETQTGTSTTTVNVNLYETGHGSDSFDKAVLAVPPPAPPPGPTTPAFPEIELSEKYPVFAVYVDWYNDGDYSAPGSDVTQRTLTRTDIAASYGRDQLRALSPAKPGVLTVELKNFSRDYSPENTSSPLYGNLVPGRAIWVTVAQGENTYNFYRGFIDDYVILPNVEDRTLQISCMDVIARFQQVNLSTPLYGPGVRTGDAIGYLLDELNWPSDQRDIDPGATTIRWWWEEGTDALTALNKILGAEGPPAFAFVDAPSGFFVFRDRHHRLLRTESIDVQANFSGGLVPETAIANLIPDADSNFEAPLTGKWIAWSNCSTPTLDTSIYYGDAGASLKIVSTSSGQFVFIYNSHIDAYEKQPITLTAEIYSPVSTSCNITLYYYDANNNGLGSKTVGMNIVAGWNDYYVKFSPPAGCDNAVAWINITATAPSQAFYLDNFRWAPLATATYSAPFTYDAGWRDIVNTITVSVDERSVAGDLAVVWSSDSLISVPNGGVVTIASQASDPFTGAVLPDPDIDYDLQYGSVDIELSRTNGQSAIITITDTGGGSLLSGLQLRAYPVAVARTVQVSLQDQTSVTSYGVRTLPSTIDMSLACIEDAEAVGQTLLARYSQRRPIITMPVKNTNGYRLYQQLSRNLSDRIHVIDNETGLDSDFFIEQISHSAADAGMLITTTFGCEKSIEQPSNAFTFNATGQGFDDGAFGIPGLDAASSVFIFNDVTQGQFNVGQFGT